jgi:drug/metabolite transporter (DMT)-like permease
LSAVVLGNVFASIAAMPFALPFPVASTGEWVTVAYLGVCQIGLAYVFLTAGIRHLQALEASLLLLVEPALNPVWTWIIRGESPGTWTIVGGGIILAATALRSLHDAHMSPRLVAE